MATGDKGKPDYAMGAEVQAEIKAMAIKYHQYKIKAEKSPSKQWRKKFLEQAIDTRNMAYLKIKDWQLKWVKSILARWGRWETPQNILAFSWDAFYFCIERYKNYDIPIPKHFHDYSRYYLLNYYAKQDHVTVLTEELVETLSLIKTDENVVFIKLLQLQQMKDVLPKEFQGVWDDAIHSLHHSPPDRHTEEGMYGLPRQVYYNLKRSFKPLIEYVLKK